MSFQRREFLKLTGGIASGIVLSSFTGKLALNDDFFEKRRRLKNFGINLYSLRDVLRYPISKWFSFFIHQYSAVRFCTSIILFLIFTIKQRDMALLKKVI